MSGDTTRTGPERLIAALGAVRLAAADDLRGMLAALGPRPDDLALIAVAVELAHDAAYAQGCTADDVLSELISEHLRLAQEDDA